MKPRVAVLGAGGQVGRAWLELLGASGIALDRTRANLERPESVLSALSEVRPDVVVNAAAYTAVDAAESSPELARVVNASAPGEIAGWCAAHQIPLVHYSTDYVFSGEGKTPWSESDPTAPVSVYGVTKLEGERKVAEHGDQYLIFRTSWVYDAVGRNFFRTMLKLGAERDVLRVVGDQIGAPTYAPDLARISFEALKVALSMDRFPSGTYHLCGAGETSWHGFAEAIFFEARRRGLSLRVSQVERIVSKEYPTPAKRPQNSRLDTSRFSAVFGTSMPQWKAGLSECMDRFLKLGEW